MGHSDLGTQHEFCGVCCIVLPPEFFRCPKCRKLICHTCWSATEKHCVDCGSDDPGEARPPSEAKLKKVPNPAFMLPLAVSPTLAAVVGPGPLARTEVTKRMWEYIRKNGLQDKRKRTIINADALLCEVFGGRLQVSMFEMTKLVSKHLLRD